MADLGTVSILVDVRGQPIIRELAKDLNNTAVAEKRVSDRAKQVIADMQRLRTIMSNVKQATDSATNSFQRFSAQELQQAGQRMQGFERALANTRRSMGQMGQATQQFGYQVGDFFVQVQSGTNVLVAFGQQATQLVGILPAFYKQLGMSVGALIGISSGLGIAIPLLTAIGAAFMRSGNNAEESAKQIDTYKEAYEGLTESIRNLRLEQQMMESGLGEKQQTATNELLRLQAEYNVLLIEQAELAEKYADASLMGQTQEQRANTEALAATRKKIAALERIIRIEEETARIVNAAKAAEAIRGALATKNAEDLNRAMEKALDAGVKFSQTDLASIVALAAKNGWSLASAIQAAFAAAGGGIVVSADPSMGPGFEGRGRNRGQIVQATYKPTFSELYERDIAKGSKGGGGGAKTDPLEQLRQQIKLEAELLGMSEAQARVIKALGQDRSKYSEAEINAITAEIEAYMQKQEAIERTKKIMDTVKSSMENAFMSMVDGTKSAKEAFRTMAAEIIRELYRVLVVQQLVNSISGAIGGIFGGSSAPASSPRPMPRPVGAAVGGSIMTGGTYLVGENGPELVIPRHSGTVVNANQTANAMGGGGSVTVQNNITVTGSDAAMVRTEIAKMIPQITNATKAAVIDARLRGGQMKAAFS